MKMWWSRADRMIEAVVSHNLKCSNQPAAGAWALASCSTITVHYWMGTADVHWQALLLLKLEA
jgi:hypothetical protein